MIEKKIESGNFDWDASLEDVHMNIESAPRERNFTPRAAGTIRLRSIFDLMLKQKLLRYPLAFAHCKPRCSISRSSMSMLSCRVIPTCSVPSQFSSRITCAN